MTPEQSAGSHHQTCLNTAAYYLSLDVDLSRPDWQSTVPLPLLTELIEASRAYEAANSAVLEAAFARHDPAKVAK